MNPLYSICMCNYNMERTLEQSLTSILDQLDERFEVLVVDDGSTDNSVAVIKDLQKHYPALRLVELMRDRKRKLGLTRNVSVQEARGEYVLLHLDCDDIYAPFLKDFTTVFHQIEKAIGKDVLVSGEHINMARRTFLLEHGPYRNIFRGEDRDLWIRLAAKDAYIRLSHVDFATRLPHPVSKKNMRSFFYTWDHMVNDFRAGMRFTTFLRGELTRKDPISWKMRLCRFVFAIPTYITARLKEPLKLPDNMSTLEAFDAHREKTRGTFQQLMARYHHEPDYSALSEPGKEILNKKGF